MSEDLKRVLATLAGYPVIWLFAGLLHIVDGGISGLGGLLSMEVITSISAMAALLFFPCLIAVISFGARGAGTYWAVIIGAALLIGGLLTIAGSTASDFWGYAVSFSGITLVCTLFLMPGTLPGVLFLKRVKGRRSSS